MKNFGFTEKKFMSLSERGKQNHIVSWLGEVYQTLSAGRVSRQQFEAFHTRYRMILAWLDRPCPPLPDSEDTREWLVFVSDLIHGHRTASGKILRDHDLLEKVVTGDREVPENIRPDMEYQVALDGLRSLFNVGSIFRTCEAAGIRTLVLGNCLGKESPQVRKTAMGAQERIVEEHTRDLAQALEVKKEAGFTVICVETVAGSVPCHEYTWPAKAVLVMGNEEYGISPHVLRTADDMVHIPMFGKKNSLNVANALSAVLYQAVFSRLGRKGLTS